jgi:hypothetical protein
MKEHLNNNKNNNTDNVVLLAERFNEPIHEWFELSYAQYLTIPRSVLQSMPKEWQDRFVQCLDELDEKIDWRPQEGCYRVQLMTTKEVYDKKEKQFIEKWGNQIDDPLMDYQRGRRRVPFCS